MEQYLQSLVQEQQMDQFDIDIPQEDMQCDINFYTKKDNEDQPLREEFIKNLKENPQHYFNFGMNFDDFRAFIRKIIWMREMRKNIEEAAYKLCEDLQKRRDNSQQQQQ